TIGGFVSDDGLQGCTAVYVAYRQEYSRTPTPSIDRYALVVVAFEILTGERPYENDSITAEATAHVHAPVPAASERHRDVPPQTDGVFRRALAKDPAQRYSSCGELVASLRPAYDAAAGSTSIAAPTPP